MTKIWQKYEKMSKAGISIYARPLCLLSARPASQQTRPAWSLRGPRSASVYAVSQTSNGHNLLSVTLFSVFYNFLESLREDL